MSKRMIWGLSVLLVLVIAGVSYMFAVQYAEIRQLKKEAAEAEKLLEEKNMPIVENNQQSARPGFKLVPHDDHFHEVPIDAPDVWQEGTQETAVPQKQHTVDASGEVIYPHHELLQTHPVAALRAQARDSGHWSTEYIPPFPADDVEANELARAFYVSNYYYTLGDLNHPIRAKAQEFIAKWDHEAWKTYPLSARVNDLLVFHWTGFDRSLFEDVYFEEIYPTRRTTFTQEDFDRANNK